MNSPCSAPARSTRCACGSSRPLARELPEPLFLNYVFHPRVNEEELCDCRGFFYAQIRGRIEGLSAREAILAINEWNAEQVCYRATDERTISALGAWALRLWPLRGRIHVRGQRAARSRDPARQVYTPRWAHCDDNHAWVEAYCGGAWHFFGACEPEEALDRGWFTGAASRALLVHSRCFGTPAADEEIISVDGAVTFLNQTARYAPVRLLAVRVREKDGRPAAVRRSRSAFSTRRRSFRLRSFGRMRTEWRGCAADTAI